MSLFQRIHFSSFSKIKIQKRGLCLTPFSSIPCRCFSTEKNLQYVCIKCGKEYPKWQGQCHSCNEWNTIEKKEEDIGFHLQKPLQYNPAVKSKIKVKNLNEVDIKKKDRFVFDSCELNRVFGGGMVQGSLVLIGGEPGIGKSSLLLRIASDICKNDKRRVLYISAEESEEQVKLRSDRLNIHHNNFFLLHETNLDAILQYLVSCKESYSAVIIDSIQTVQTQECTSAPGSIQQVRFCAACLQNLAKSLDLSILISGHVTKTGDLAGPRTLEHLVDAVFYLEGDSVSNNRILRSVKNRFGPAPEVGIFEMVNHGLVDKQDVYTSFLSFDPHGKQVTKQLLAEGSSIGMIANGSRPLPIEFQSLVCKVNSPYRPPQSRCICFSFDRLQLLLAMLRSKQKLFKSNVDVFLNVVGGMNVVDNAADLPVVMSLISSIKNTCLPSYTCFFGEIGLTGELRPVPYVDERIKLASYLGFKQCYIPYYDSSVLLKNDERFDRENEVYQDMQIFRNKSIQDVIDSVFA